MMCTAELTNTLRYSIRHVTLNVSPVRREKQNLHRLRIDLDDSLLLVLAVLLFLLHVLPCTRSCQLDWEI